MKKFIWKIKQYLLTFIKSTTMAREIITHNHYHFADPDSQKLFDLMNKKLDQLLIQSNINTQKILEAIGDPTKITELAAQLDSSNTSLQNVIDANNQILKK